MNKLLIHAIVLSQLVGCGDTGRQNQVPTHKTNGGPQKVVSEKVQQAALKAGVLLEVQPRSFVISEISSSEVQLSLRFLLNQQNAVGFRKYQFNIRKGEELTLDNSQFDLTQDSRLKIELYRFEGPTKKDLLSLHFQFENRAAGEDVEKSSSLVLLVELLKSTKSPLKTEFIYPSLEDFDLKKWSEALVKDSLPQ